VTANNITRLLEARKIAFTAYDLPPEKLGALETARLLGVPAEQVFKTIVAARERGKPILAVIPGPRQLDLKKLASALGEKKVRLPGEREAEQMTGLQAGGISPLALVNRGFTIVLDAAARAHAQIHVSGGQRGLNIRLSVMELIALTGAQVADVCAAE
jgi:Cys-tRNA(Pro)/Cys-tRNA(Cys) deacylase